MRLILALQLQTVAMRPGMHAALCDKPSRRALVSQCWGAAGQLNPHRTS